jgi:hypothetical protein
MSRLSIIFVWASIVLFGQRVPGRVGGSPNSPQANRPLKTKPSDAGSNQAFALTTLPPEQLEEFQRAKAVMPELTQADFQRLRLLSEQMNTSGKQISVVDLAAKLHHRHGDIVRVLRDAGLSKKEAKDLIERAK